MVVDLVFWFPTLLEDIPPCFPPCVLKNIVGVGFCYFIRFSGRTKEMKDMQLSTLE